VRVRLKTKIEYLGLSSPVAKREMDPVKIAGVAEWPTPDKQERVQSSWALPNFTAASSRILGRGRPMVDLQGREGLRRRWGKWREKPSRAIRTR